MVPNVRTTQGWVCLQCKLQVVTIDRERKNKGVTIERKKKDEDKEK